ncbi:TonB-dependent receptor domain-containing protein [Sphingopyxis sp. DBS4]|uniref:TonB-dependent receptor domain-containing protein n=1 Tax=Sphingopyxis sp. DBS4 TaxID=2968500 RepID=UPI00214C4F81|nr:TonB-dependent receptor [Sphingopyxis sp. DBS4]
MKTTHYSKLKLGAAPFVLGIGLLAAASPAMAQDAQTGDTATTGDEIIVTGTRIPQANLESAAPITVVSAEDIKLQGTTRVEDMLNSLPSVFASQSSTAANGADGTASVDLRGLGTTRTLSLVNGRRLLPGDPSPGSGSAADINMIPAALLKNVQVLTGGASATYGADAVAGVVNFVMDTDFTGFRLDGQYSVFQHNNRNKLAPGINDARGFGYPRGSVVDGGTVDVTATFGAAFDDGRGHIVAYAGYRKANAILQSRRDYSACTIQNTGGGVPNCGGSLTNATGTAIIFDPNVTTAGSTVYSFLPGGGFENTTSRYNFAPTNHYQRPDERYTAGLFANYEINESIKPYLEFMFMDDRTVAQIAPSGDFGNTLTVNCDNPLMSTAQHDIICAAPNLINGYIGNFPTAVAAPYNTIANGGPGPLAPPLVFTGPFGQTYNQAFMQVLRRNVEGGPRQSDLQHTNFRTVIGSKGDLGKAWSYDAYYQYGRSNYSQVYSNEFSVARLNRALNVVDEGMERNGVANGNYVCRSVIDGSDPTCQPYNIFNGAGGASPESIAYLSATGFQKGYTSEQVANASFTGLLGEYGIKSPWADDGISVNLGFEWRKESLELKTDNAFTTGDLTGQGGATLPLAGSFRVYEFFAETQVPIVHDSFIYDLSFSGGYRKSWYRTSADRKYDTDTYKLQLEFAPIRDVRFRGQYNRAVRAPNIQELFATPTVGLAGATDPCAGAPIAATNYGCLAQENLSVGQSITENPAGQYNGLLGGNPDLKPETATTKTFGVVLQPSFLPRFSLTVDWFDIKLKDAIQPPAQDAILKDCTLNATADFTPYSCSLIHRDVTGSLWLTPLGYVDNTPSNLGRVRTRGLEINSAYSHEIGNAGTLSMSFVGTYLDKYKVDNGITQAYDCAGLYGPVCSSGGTTAGGSMLPKWRHKLRTTFNMPNGIGLSLQWRYIGKVKAETLDASQSLHGDNNFDPGLHLKAYSYFDLATTFAVSDNYTFRLGVNNILDKQPPLVTSGNAGKDGSNLCPTGPCNGNTYPATYDALGRYIYAGVTLDF